MTDVKEEFEKINLEKPEKEMVSAQKELQENKEILPGREVNETKELRQKIEAMDLPDDVKHQVATTAQNLTSAPPQEKIAKLLLLAQEKGVVYAVNVAKKMNNPYILDALHDALAEKGLYKKFKQ